MNRRYSKTVFVGDLPIGGESKISVQSMLNIPVDDIERNVMQAKSLEDSGCEVIRAAVPNMKSVKLIDSLKNAVKVPIVADIHFDYRLAVESAAAGADKIRINPGNIGDESRIKAVVDMCKIKNIPIRIGVNSGSLEKEILNKYERPTAEALRDSALYHASLLEKFDFDNIILSIKSSDVKTMVKAYELTAEACGYPLHLGVTEAGTESIGIIKSAIGIGSLLLKGIGDTIRVSLTADPIKEIKVGYQILSALNLRNERVKIISCPTCGRTKVDLISLVEEAEDKLKNIKKPITVAIMGCAVNGPGEAREADIGVAFGDGSGVIFKNGSIVKKIKQEDVINKLLKEIEEM